MEKSLKNELTLNGQPQMQMGSEYLMQNGVKQENEERKTFKLLHPDNSEMSCGQNLDDPQVFQKSWTDYINGSSNSINLGNSDDLAKSDRTELTLLVAECQETRLNKKNAMATVDQVKIETVSDGENVKTGMLSDVASNSEAVINKDRKMEHKCILRNQDNEFNRPLENNSGNNYILSDKKYSASRCLAKEFELSEDSRFLENRILDEHVEKKYCEAKTDNSVIDLQTFSGDVDKCGLDTKKLQKSKTPDSFRPFARMLHDIGQELVRQLVYKELIEIQEAKDAKHKLDDKNRSQLIKLTEAHTKLCAKNEAYQMPVKSCRCGFMSSSDNVMALHHEFGHSLEQFPHVCCCCDSFKSKWPSQFVAHMETVHEVKARIQKKLAQNTCFFCPYEHKNWMKIEMHMSKCCNKFSLSGNLQPQPADCDIPVLYKPGHAQKIYPIAQPALASMTGRFPPQSSNQVTPPVVVTAGQSSVMEIDGQLYSLVNHNGKVLLTSLRSQIGGASSTGAVIPPSTCAAKVTFPPTRSQQSTLDSIKPNVPVHRETCEICGAVVSNREALWNHFRDIHRVELSRTSMREQEPWMKCTFCSTRFWTYQGLARHSSTHHNRNIAPLPQAMNASRFTRCYLCGNSQTSNPLNHFSTFHNITLLDMYQSRQCCMCNKRLKQSRAFEEHMIVQHRDIFANSEVLQTVIQALSTAYYLKSEDGILQRPPLMVQHLQQKVTGTGTISGVKTVSTAKLPSGMMVSSTRTVSGVGMTSGIRTVSGANLFTGMKMISGINMVSGTRMGPSVGVTSNMKTTSHMNMTSGVNITSNATGMKTISGIKTASVTSSSCGKICSSNSRSSLDAVKIMRATAVTLGTVKTAKSVDSKKSRTKTDSADQSRANEQCASTANRTPKKTKEEDEKDLNKLYKELSDIGRPILRSMRHRLTQSEDKHGPLKRSAELMLLGLSPDDVRANCSTKTKADERNTGLPKKKLRLDLDNVVTTQENLFRAEESEVCKIDPCNFLATETHGKITDPVQSGTNV